MTELYSEVSIVEALRSKIEESEIKQYLKSTLGGYTKQSVMDYVNMLRKNQQSIAETFFHNQQALFDEKENLKKANTALKTRLNQVEDEYKALADSVHIYKLDDEEITAESVAALRINIVELEDELNRGESEKNSLEKQIEHLNIEINDLKLKLEQSAQEKRSLKEILRAELEKFNNQKALISLLACTIEDKDEEIKFLNALISEGQIASLKEKISELIEQLETQAEMIQNYNCENELKSQIIETLNQENAVLKHRISDLQKSFEEINNQNSKYIAANTALTDQLESEYKKTINLIKERSAVTIDKLSVARKLDEANTKITLLELQVKNLVNTEAAASAFENLNQITESSAVTQINEA